MVVTLVKLLSCFALALVLVAGGLETGPVDFVQTGWTMFLWLAMLITAVVALARSRAQTRRFGSMGLGLLAMTALTPATCSAIGNGQRSVSEQRGDTIRQALARYRQENDKFPTSLAALVPRYLAIVPSTRTGFFREEPFLYEPTDDGQDFDLSFVIPGYWCTSTRSTAWLVDD